LKTSVNDFSSLFLSPAVLSNWFRRVKLISYKRRRHEDLRTEEVHMPKELLWDYKKPPEDVLWRLQRITDFFPAYGTDRKTVKLLFEYSIEIS
jgi:hypothetical protein